MSDVTGYEDAFQRRVKDAARRLSAYAGHFIERISFDAFPQEDSMEIALQGASGKPDVVLSLSDLHHISVAKGPELSGSFIDKISLIHLPKMPQPWPDAATGRLRRFGGLPELAWFRIIGPTAVDAIASIVTLYTSISDDEAG